MTMRKLLNVFTILCLATILPLSIGGCNLLGGLIGNTNDNDDNDNNGNDNGVDERFVRFTDPEDETFSTPDVRDSDDDIVRFDSEDDSIVWAEDGTAYQAGTWVVNGNFLGTGQAFQVRFGTVSGERRAYFTETGPATICQIEPVGGGLAISATAETVPQE